MTELVGLNVRHPLINLHNQAVLVRNSLIQLLKFAVKILVEKNGFSADVEDLVEVEPPKQADHGDFATNFCLVASKPLGQNPRALAEMLVEAIREADATQLVTEIEIAGPGFINFRLSPTQVAEHIGTVLAEGESFGNLVNKSPERINVEFVSVNPNGPITIGSGRGAAFGSALCNVLEAAGNTVHREYYINDGVNSEQMRLFAESVRAIILKTPFPESGYKGDYVQAVGDALAIQSLRSARIADLLEFGQAFSPTYFPDPISLETALEKFAGHHRTLRELKYNGGNPNSIHDQLVESEKNNIVKTWISYTFTYIWKEYRDVKADSVIYIFDDYLMKSLMRAISIVMATNLYSEKLPSGDDVVPINNITLLCSLTDMLTDTFTEGVQEIPDKAKDMVSKSAQSLADVMKNFSEVHWNEKERDKLMQLISVQPLNIDVRVALAARLLHLNLNELTPQQVKSISERIMLITQKSDLTRFQVTFDTWFSEQSLHDSGEVEHELQHLLTAKVADDKPYRTKVVMAKGGVIKEVLKEEQPTDEEEADLAEVPPPSMGGGRGGVEPEEKTQESNKTIWLRSTKFGDDQDRVLKRKDGRLTYIASDVAYHKDKFNRPANGNKLITVLGPDHHGYIARLTAVVAAMFSDQVEPLDNPEPLSEHESLIYDSVADRNQCQAALAWAKEHLQVQIFQIVRFLKDGKPAPMRKRDGNIYALIDLVNEIGAVLRPNGTEAEKQQAGSDVARFFYLMRHHDTAMDFDLELATKQSDENPVFYVQYAHARISSVLEKAKESGFELPPLRGNGEGERGGEVLRMSSINPGLLNHAKEIALILKICDLPHEIERTAHDYSVNRLTTYAIELARTYHSFYDSCRVIQSDQPELTRARLALCQATCIALRNALSLLGVSAPERMDRAVSN